MANIKLTPEDKYEIIRLVLQGITIDRISLFIKKKSNTVKKFVIKNRIRELKKINSRNELHFIIHAIANNLDLDTAKQLYLISKNAN